MKTIEQFLESKKLREDISFSECEDLIMEYSLMVAEAVKEACAERATAYWVFDHQNHDTGDGAEVDKETILGIDVNEFVK